VFSYEPVERLPEGAEARDASEVASFDLVKDYVERSRYTIAANLWRYALLRKGLGIWIDADLYLFRPIVSPGDYSFAWQDAKTINNAVLHLPSGSELLSKLWKFVTEEYPAGSLDQLPWATTGPTILTRFALETGDARWALERRVFYPIPWQLYMASFQPTGDWRRWCSDRTVGIHLWNQLLPDSAVENAPAGTLLHDIMECHRKGSGVLSLRSQELVDP
jgi:hypothetical protein